MILQLKKVSKRFKLHHQNGAELQVLDHVDLSVNAGECVVLDGPSGMGNYHGADGFKTFSHMRAVYRQTGIDVAGIGGFKPQTLGSIARPAHRG